MEEELQSLNEDIEAVRGEKTALQDALTERESELEETKRVASKATKRFDKQIKEIGTLNDLIEKHASDRFGIYRRCTLEEIDLPLLKGSLDRVPAEEVRLSLTCCYQTKIDLLVCLSDFARRKRYGYRWRGL